MRAWHRGKLAELLREEPGYIAERLTAAAASRRLEPNPEALEAWSFSVGLMRDVAVFLSKNHPSGLEWYYFLEFEVPRRSRRIDVAIVADEIIFLLECKIGSVRFERAALWQAEQYALDMRDFHEGSRDRIIVPVLVATAAQGDGLVARFDRSRLVQPVRRATAAGLADTIYESWQSAHDPTSSPIAPLVWEDSAYRPTPSIIDAARLLYEQNDVREIGLSGAENLTATVDAVLDLVRLCRSEHKRGIAFVTGAPGSGKTLAGLQVVHTPELIDEAGAAGVFLSGNRPLVEVISEALAISAARAGKRTRREVDREVRTFIQHAYVFRNEYAEEPLRLPPEHIILFDEAQRAWDAKRVKEWTRRASTRSEPQIFLDVMTRAQDWAVVIALVGSGQEINNGEAGLGEWGRALELFHKDWIIRASPSVLPGAPAPPGGRLFDVLPDALTIEEDARLHLQMNVRSPRAERLNQWVDNLLDFRVEDAWKMMPDSREYPMVLTRSFDAAKDWLRDRADDDQRTGLLASADARRLRAWGVDTRTMQREGSWAHWFLRDRGDIRGSDQLEVAATNFDCQGLEIDWAGVCWGNDLVPDAASGSWRRRQFMGSRWTKPGSERARFILNGYRVLLTRARRGQIIWVPEPDGSDGTLDPADFEAITDVLVASGIPMLD